MAGQLRITSHQLSQTLSARFEKNFNQLLNSYRIEEAFRLMDQEPQLSLEDIGYKAGFNSRVTFSRNFKLEKGCSPSQYRKMTLEVDR